MIGPSVPIVIPKIAQPVEEHLSDYEVELTIVIGKVAKNVSEADALDYVLGYTGANDVGASPGPDLNSLWTLLLPGLFPQAPDDDFSVELLKGFRSVISCSIA